MQKLMERQEKTESPTQNLEKLAKKHGTPLFIIDHAKIKENYAEFKASLPRVQAYYAVKANSNPEIVRTLYKLGASFDVASFPEFMIVYENIKNMPADEQQTAREAYEHTGFRQNTPIKGTKIDVAFIGSCTNSRISKVCCIV